MLEVIEVREETAFPETGTLVMEEEIVTLGAEILGATEETVNQEVETLEAVTAFIGTEIMMKPIK